MAKRKSRRNAGSTPGRRAATVRSRTTKKTPASKRRAAGSARKPARSKARKPVRKPLPRSSRKAAAKKTSATRRPTARTTKKAVRLTKRAAPPKRAAAVPKKQAVSKKSKPRAASPKAASKAASTKLARFRPPAGKSPALDRERRTIADDDVLPGPPSSLDLDRTASSFRSGRKNLRDRYDAHTETGPALTGGDVDADWESAYSVGDEAPGGDSPTPDQDVVEEIGQAAGINYEDNEELGTEEKVVERDRHRWELDPASSDDFEDR